MVWCRVGSVCVGVERGVCLCVCRHRVSVY